MKLSFNVAVEVDTKELEKISSRRQRVGNPPAVAVDEVENLLTLSLRHASFVRDAVVTSTGPKRNGHKVNFDV